MGFYYSITLLIVLSVLFGYINERYLRLPMTIGSMLIAVLMIIIDRICLGRLSKRSLTITYYAAVVFSIVVQGLSVNSLIKSRNILE